jgi:hypothetical protein
MSRRRLSRAAVLCCALALLPASAFAGGALVKVNDLILRANGSFRPNALPRHKFAPIEFEGYFNVAAKGGGEPVALGQAIIDFDRDGRLNAGGLPVCQPEWIAAAGVAEARRTCGGAIVGTGRIEALVSLPTGTVAAGSALTIFNGPPLDGNPTVILHARTTVPAIQTYAIVVPIERHRGHYRATLDLPPIAGGLGAITHVSVQIGRRFRVDGQRRNYVSARCATGILKTHGHFSFADGTIIDGIVETPCTPR